MDTVSTVMMAVQGGVRLYGAFRRADADVKRAAGLVLPLPLADDPGYPAARGWFQSDADGQAFAEADAEIRRVAHDPGTPTAGEKAWLVAQYRRFSPAADPAVVAGFGMSVGEAKALWIVRQWAPGESAAPKSALQTVAGEVANIAIDYFVQTPGAVSEKRPEGRALRAVLEALDDTDFATADLRDASGQIVLAVIGAVAENPDLAGGGEKQQILVRGVTSALATSAAKHLGPGTPTDARLAAAEWLRLVGAAVLRGGADAVAANPAVFLGSGESFGGPGDPKKTVIFDVTKTVADLLVGDDDLLTMRSLLSADGLHTVVQATVDALAENPDVLGPDRRGLRTILLAVAKDLADRKGLPKDLGPEIVRLVLARTADNLDLVWPDATHADPAKHLLLTAAKSLLGQLATPADGTWRPKLTKEQMLDLVEDVLDDVIDNPSWLVQHASGVGSDLGVAVAAMVTALAAIPGPRLNGAAAASAIHAGLVAAAQNLDFLATLPPAAGAPARTALEAAVAAIVGELFDPAASQHAQWSLARASVAVTMIEIALDALADRGVSQADIDAVGEVVAKWVADGRAFDETEFAEDVFDVLA